MSDRPQFSSARGMRFYLAGRYDRREELAHQAHFLECFGHHSTARWLTGAHEKPELAGNSLDGYTTSELAGFAAQDLDDIDAADLVIAFTESNDVGYTSGGRHVELGYAIGKGKHIAIVGPRENVFMHAIVVCEPSLTHLIAHYGSGFNWVRRGCGDDDAT